MRRPNPLHRRPALTLSPVRVGQAIAVLGTASTVELIAELLDDDPTAVRASMRHLAAQVHFDHREIGDLILREMPEPTRRRLHERAAELLYQRGFPVAVVADQLVGADSSGYPWAADVLLDAAAEALADDRIDCATERLELAYRAIGDPARRAEIAIRLVGVEWRTNPSNRMRSYLRLKAALHASRVPTAELPAAVMFLLWHGQTQQADHALDILGADRTGKAAPEIDFLGAWLRFTHPPHAHRHQQSFMSRAQPATSNPQSVHRLGADLFTGLLTRRPLGDIGTLAQRVLTGNRLGTNSFEILVAAIQCLIYADRLDTALSWCDALLAEADARRAPTWQSIFTGLRAETMLRKGNVATAATDAAAALNQVPAEHLGIWIGTPLAVSISSLTLAGRHAEAGEQLQRPVPRALFESRFGLAYLHARGHHYLAVDRADVALRDFRRCGLQMSRWDLDFPWLPPWRNDIAAACLALGEQRQSRIFATRHLGLLGGAQHHRTGAVSLRLLAITADRYQRVRLLRDAAAIARSGGDELELATVLGELGRAHRAVGDSDRSRTLTRDAARIAASVGAEPLLHDLLGHRSQPTPQTMLPPTNGIDALSPAELRVAELAALGRPNREIATTLAITTSTVEQHLTRVYRKLEIARRSELRFVLRPHRAEPEAATG